MEAANGKTCTLMVAMLIDIPPGEFVDQPRGGPSLATREYLSWRTISHAFSDILVECVRKKGDKAGFGWARLGMHASSPPRSFGQGGVDEVLY